MGVLFFFPTAETQYPNETAPKKKALRSRAPLLKDNLKNKLKGCSRRDTMKTPPYFYAIFQF